MNGTSNLHTGNETYATQERWKTLRAVDDRNRWDTPAT
jgi:hypothetical protein